MLHLSYVLVPWIEMPAVPGQEQGRNRAGAELRRVEQSRAERGQGPGMSWEYSHVGT